MAKKKVLILSNEGDGLGVGQRLAMQGCEVFFWQKELREGDRSGEGILKKVGSWRPYFRDVDLIICDLIGMGRFESVFEEAGVPFLCCNKVIDQIELDRAKGMSLFQKVGIDIPKTYNYGSLAEAKPQLRKLDWGNGIVLKPHDNQSSSKTMTVKEQEKLEWALGLMPPGPITVQEIVDGVEVSTEAWFNGSDFVRPFDHTFEEKKFMAGNLGYNTGCMGNVVFTSPGNKLTAMTVERLKPFLKLIRYRGAIDVNCIVNEKGAYALEATPRLGYDAIEAYLEGLQEPAFDFFHGIASGTKTEIKITKDVMIAVRLTVPPWPNAKPKKEDRGEPILGINDANIKHIFLTDVYLDKDGVYKAGGGDGVLLKATAIGRVRDGDYTGEARARVYRTLKGLKVSGKQYRLDIGERVNGDVAKLKKWGWL